MFDKQDMIAKFISNEITQVYKKYNNISEVDFELICNFITVIKARNFPFDVYEDYNKTLEYSHLYKDYGNVDWIALKMYLDDNFTHTFDDNEIINMSNMLASDEIVETDDFYLYVDRQEQDMIDKAKEDLIHKLEYADEVVELFEPSEIAEMWIEQRNVEQVVNKLIHNVSWYELMGYSEPEEAYLTYDRKLIMYVKKNGE